MISIHSPRMGRDGQPQRAGAARPISIHSPRLGRDSSSSTLPPIRSTFQSTLPAWGETGERVRHRVGVEHFNPLSPHGERRDSVCRLLWRRHFNPLSPHGERPRVWRVWPRTTDFNPLSPHGERRSRAIRSGVVSNFNPLSPHGERRGRHEDRRPDRGFQSTLPAWGETKYIERGYITQDISIHSPRMGRDSGRAPAAIRAHISIHSPRMGRDAFSVEQVKPLTLFQSTLPAWGETRGGDCLRAGDPHFNPLSPHGERQQTHTTFRREKLAHLHNIVSFRQQRGSSC